MIAYETKSLKQIQAEYEERVAEVKDKLGRGVVDAGKAQRIIGGLTFMYGMRIIRMGDSK